MTTPLLDAQRTAAHFEDLAEQNPARYTARWAWAVNSVGSVFREQGNEAEWLAHWELAASTLRARVDVGVASDEEQHDLPSHLANMASAELQVGNLDAARRALTEAEARWANLPERLRYSYPEAPFEEYLGHLRSHLS